MTKTPEEYFQDQIFQPEPETREETFTEAEKAFLEKYLGLEEPGILEKLGIDAPVEVRSVPVPPAQDVAPLPVLEEMEHGPAPEEVLAEALEEAAVEGADEISEAPPEVAEDVEVAEVAEVGEEPESEADVEAAFSEAPEEIAVEIPVPEAEPESVLEDEDLGPEEEAQDVPLTLEAMEPEEVVVADEEQDAATVVETVPETKAETEEQPLEERLRRQEYLQLVSFYVGQQEFTLPIEAVQEVVRAVKPTKVPEAPDYMAGLVNLRGRVTPLLRLETLLNARKPQAGQDETDEANGLGANRFIIVCRGQGLQIGLLVREVATMYRTQQQNMEWNIETRLGGAAELVTALMRRQDDTLVSVLSIDRVVERILKR